MTRTLMVLAVERAPPFFADFTSLLMEVTDMNYWVEEKSDFDGLWELVMAFEFKENSEKFIRRACEDGPISIDSLRIVNVKNGEITCLMS